MGLVETSVEPDGLPKVGDRPVQVPTLPPQQAAVNQQHVAELRHRLALEQPQGPGIVLLGGREVILRFPREVACLRRDPARLGEDRPHLARGEPAQQVEPGEVGILIQAGVQASLGLQRPSKLEVADGREALGPEMIRLLAQRGVEVAERLVPPAAFVPLLAGQELVEGRDR